MAATIGTATVLDDELHTLRDEVLASSHITNEVQRGKVIDRVTTLVLIDIAASLRILSSGYAELAPVLEDREAEEPNAGEPDGPERQSEPDAHETIDPDPGDWVRAAPGTPEWTHTNGEPRQVVAAGVSEGAAWLQYRNPDDTVSPKVWASKFAYAKDGAAASEPDETVVTDDEPDTVVAAQGYVDDLDADFTGEVAKLSKKERKALLKGKRPVNEPPEDDD